MYILIAGNKNCSLEWSVICQEISDYMPDLDLKAKEFSHCDYCYAVDTDEGGKVVRDYKIPTWANRENADTKSAAKLIANRLVELSFNSNNDVSSYQEVEEFAKKKGIPFSAELHCNYIVKWKEENPNWDSSSMNC